MDFSTDLSIFELFKIVAWIASIDTVPLDKDRLNKTGNALTVSTFSKQQVEKETEPIITGTAVPVTEKEAEKSDIAPNGASEEKIDIDNQNIIIDTAPNGAPTEITEDQDLRMIRNILLFQE